MKEGIRTNNMTTNMAYKVLYKKINSDSWKQDDMYYSSVIKALQVRDNYIDKGYVSKVERVNENYKQQLSKELLSLIESK